MIGPRTATPPRTTPPPHFNASVQLEEAVLYYLQTTQNFNTSCLALFRLTQPSLLYIRNNHTYLVCRLMRREKSPPTQNVERPSLYRAIYYTISAQHTVCYASTSSYSQEHRSPPRRSHTTSSAESHELIRLHFLYAIYTNLYAMLPMTYTRSLPTLTTSHPPTCIRNTKLLYTQLPTIQLLSKCGLHRLSYGCACLSAPCHALSLCPTTMIATVRQAL